MTTQKIPFGWIVIVALILIVAYLYGQNKKLQEAQTEKQKEAPQVSESIVRVKGIHMPRGVL